MKNANVKLAVVLGMVALISAIAFVSQRDIFQDSAVQVAEPGELPEGDAASGKQIAQFYCADCHNVENSGASPETNAPPFGKMVEQWPVEYLAEALAEGIVVSTHESVAMPEFVLEPEEIDDLLAYMESLT